MIPDLPIATLNFLSTHNLNSYTIHRNYVTYEDNGVPNVEIYLHDSIGFNIQTYNIPFPIQISSIFSMLDAYVDMLFPNLSGETFIKRYKSLPAENDSQIIFKELYRIIRKIRNQVIHQCTNITITETAIKFPNLVLSIDFLKLLYSLACEFFHYTPSLYYSHFYHIAVLRYYYDQVISGMQKAGYTDDLDSDFLSISPSVRIKVTLRYEIQNPICLFDGNQIKIQRYNGGNDKWGYCSDYKIVYGEDLFIVPDEALSSTDSISLETLSYWKVST